MGLFKNIKAAREAMAAGMRGEGPSAEALASLTPEQRAAYDAQIQRANDAMAESQAQLQASSDAEFASRPLHGPAGDHLYGARQIDRVGITPEQAAQMSAAELMEASKQQTIDGFKDLLRNPLGRSNPAPVPEGASIDPADRDRQAATERAARDAARTPYLAADRAPLHFARLATKGKTQIDEVAAYLQSSGLAARPELVYGVYRVPDRISSGIRSEKGGVVEWDVVHAVGETLPAASAPPAVTSFGARDTWVARKVGEPSVLDEDLALAYLGYAQIAPEQCLGIARHMSIENHGDSDSGSSTISQVTGVHVFHVAGPGGDVYERMDKGGPLALEPGTPAGFHVEVINWRAIARAVHPQSHKRGLIPSPFPYLPSTPQELLRSYLEIVGVRPGDCYSAQVTEDEARDIQGSGTTAKGFMTYTTNVGEEQPCADGEMRRRLTGGSHVVVVYRDSAAYAEGRARWAAYKRDVLQASLAGGTGVRRPVEQRDLLDRLPGGLRGMAKSAAWMADFVEGDGDDAFDKIPPHRYCWPPQT